MEKRVTGLGGVFLKMENPKDLTLWYDKHLGLSFGKNSYHSFKWHERGKSEQTGRTEFSLFSRESKYFAPSEGSFMLNFRVENLTELLTLLKEEGVTIVGDMETYDYGKFAWILDPEGNKIELWEPIDDVLERFDEEQNK
ncbi:MAG: VOC family protein [Saprospiraceae bacterium]|nr:VOC family protein [Saprospiraceae bacterium]